MKSGYKTSEFWFTLVSFIFSGLFLIGVIKENEHKEELIAAVSHAVESTILIGGQVLILYKYIKGRNEVKKLYASEQTKVAKLEEDVDHVERVNNSRNRKGNKPSKRVNKRSKKSSSK